LSLPGSFCSSDANPKLGACPSSGGEMEIERIVLHPGAKRGQIDATLGHRPELRRRAGSKGSLGGSNSVIRGRSPNNPDRAPSCVTLRWGPPSGQ
jgi:hypothetical protein